MVIVPFEERFGDGEVDVVTYQVSDLQRPHPKTRPPYSRVDRSRFTTGLHESQGLEVERSGDAVHDESRRVRDSDRSLAQLFGHFLDLAYGRGIGGRPGDDLDEAHRRHRVEEVHADHALWMLRSRRDPCHRERGGVGGKHCLACDNALKVSEHLALDGYVLDHGLYDHWRAGASSQGGGRRDTSDRSQTLLFREPTLLYAALQVLLDSIAAKIQSFLAYVDHYNREARKGRALCYSRSHGSRSYHGNIDHPELLTTQLPSARHD